MTEFASSVTIVDLPAGTTVSGIELFEAVQTTSGVGQSVQLTLNQMQVVSNTATLITTSVAMTNHADSQTATLTNAPSAGNPTKWIAINDNGTVRYIPCW
jgi:hypothetical protein